MLFFRHQLAVLPAMPAAGDAFEDMLARELAGGRRRRHWAVGGAEAWRGGGGAGQQLRGGPEQARHRGGDVERRCCRSLCLEQTKVWRTQGGLSAVSRNGAVTSLFGGEIHAWKAEQQGVRTGGSCEGSAEAQESCCLQHAFRPPLRRNNMTVAVSAWWQVRDAVFLHGYNEPTLLLLHETEATWSGFACERKDT